MLRTNRWTRMFYLHWLTELGNNWSIVHHCKIKHRLLCTLGYPRSGTVWTLWDHLFLSYAAGKLADKQLDSNVLPTLNDRVGSTVHWSIVHQCKIKCWLLCTLKYLRCDTVWTLGLFVFWVMLWIYKQTNRWTRTSNQADQQVGMGRTHCALLHSAST